MDAAINQLRQEGFPVYDEDVASFSAYGYGHINMLGRYSFAMPDEVKRIISKNILLNSLAFHFGTFA